MFHGLAPIKIMHLTGLLNLKTAQSDFFYAIFPSGNESFVRYHPIRLPEHETVFAMTVHKSQGSEFDKVLIVLPERQSPVLTRELLYTAITRARESVEIWGTESAVRGAVSARIQRSSGLRDLLWKEV